jgi:hypothetical protein
MNYIAGPEHESQAAALDFREFCRRVLEIEHWHFTLVLVFFRHTTSIFTADKKQ